VITPFFAEANGSEGFVTGILNSVSDFKSDIKLLLDSELSEVSASPLPPLNLFNIFSGISFPVSIFLIIGLGSSPCFSICSATAFLSD